MTNSLHIEFTDQKVFNILQQLADLGLVKLLPDSYKKLSLDDYSGVLPHDVGE